MGVLSNDLLPYRFLYLSSQKDVVNKFKKGKENPTVNNIWKST
jgi:hypothetical protein